ncbi:MAG TPA: hypothetical protein VI197_30170 [Polyangiaceae bacterium]
MPFAPHYRISVQKESDCLAETGVDDVKLPAPSRLPMADLLAVKAAIAIANKLTVGADGRTEFGGYTVYVNYCESFGESDLLATVVRQFSWDDDADYTFASPHVGRVPWKAIDALNAENGFVAE